MPGMEPIAELHCHMEGAAPIELIRSQAERYSVDLSGVFSPDGKPLAKSFTDFLKAYDLVASLFRTAGDCALLSESYLESLALQGAVYSEIAISTDHATASGMDPLDYVEGLARGIEKVRSRCGLEARMIATGLRHGGAEAVERAARWAAENPHPLVSGFGMAGDERMHEARDFARAFDIARDAGLGITAHAGEWRGAQAVAETIEWLRPSRIGHGVRAIEDSAVVEKIAREGIVLEVCPVSNLFLGVYPDLASHPLARLHDAGCRLTLNSDDPVHFSTSLAAQYALAEDSFGFSCAQLREATRTALESAFIDEATRERLLLECLSRWDSGGA